MDARIPKLCLSLFLILSTFQVIYAIDEPCCAEDSEIIINRPILSINFEAILRLVREGNDEILRYMTYEEYLEFRQGLFYLRDVERLHFVPYLKNGQVLRKESISIYTILMRNASKAPLAFLHGLKNVDHRMRKRCYVYLKYFMRFQLSYSEIDAKFYRSIINAAVKTETVTKLMILLPRLNLLVTRAEIVPQLLQGKDLLRKMDKETFKALYLKIDQEDYPPIDSFGENIANVLIGGLHNDYIGIKLVCARALRRIYNQSFDSTIKEKIRIEIIALQKWIKDNDVYLGRELEFEIESLLTAPVPTGIEFQP